MSATAASMPERETRGRFASRGRVGVWNLIAGESMLFASFIVAYATYLGKSNGGPTPEQVLRVPIFTTICLLSSGVTIRAAIVALRKGKTAAFNAWWFATLALGAIFIAGLGMEWQRLIYQEHFTMRTSIFGATYYALIGLHASHVIIGLIGLAIVMVLSLAGKVKREHAERCELLSMYWHFVDVAWLVIFTLVYVVGR